MLQNISKPTVDEYNLYFADYIESVPDDQSIWSHLQTSLDKLVDFAQQFSDNQLAQPHAAGEWSIKEVIGHMIDVERIFTYRALRQARNDKTPLAGFDPSQLATNSNATMRNIQILIAEFKAVRMATIALFNSFDDEAFRQKGISENSLSVRAIAYFLVGHERHHFNSLQENYGVKNN